MFFWGKFAGFKILLPILLFFFRKGETFVLCVKCPDSENLCFFLKDLKKNKPIKSPRTKHKITHSIILTQSLHFAQTALGPLEK